MRVYLFPDGTIKSADDYKVLDLDVKLGDDVKVAVLATVTPWELSKMQLEGDLHVIQVVASGNIVWKAGDTPTDPKVLEDGMLFMPAPEADGESREDPWPL
jgi:hypothetical protein